MTSGKVNSLSLPKGTPPRFSDTIEMPALVVWALLDPARLYEGAKQSLTNGRASVAVFFGPAVRSR